MKENGSGSAFGGLGPQASVAGSLLFYFASSMSLTFFNKWFFADPKTVVVGVHTVGDASVLEQPTAAPTRHPFSTGTKFVSPYGFHFPLTVTCLHQFLLFILVLVFERSLLRRVAGEISKSRQLAYSIVPVGVLCGLDWGLSNTSLRYVTVSLYEMVKACTPIIVAIFSVLLGFTQRSATLVVIVVLATCGLILSITGGNFGNIFTDSFPMVGFVCVTAATGLASVRVLWAQRLLQGAAGDLRDSVNSITVLYFAAPASAVALIAPAAFVEGSEVIQYWSNASGSRRAEISIIIGLSVILAFFLSIAELVVTRKTSALTLCICGIAKQVAIVLLAMFIFGDRLGPINAFGFGLTLMGILFYNLVRLRALSPQFIRLPTTDEAPTSPPVLPQDNLELQPVELSGVTNGRQRATYYLPK